MYSLAALAAVIGVLLVLRPVLARFPSAALGAIVVYAAVLLVDARAFRRLAAFRRSEFLLAVAACAGVLAFNILYGVLLAIAISVGDMLLRVARPHDAILGRVPGVGGMHDIDDYPEAQTIPGLVVYRYDAPLFFANSEDFKRRALAAADQQAQPVAWYILNVEANVEVDFTGLDALDAVRENLAQRGTIFALARVKQDVLRDLEAFGLAEKIGAEYMFPTLPLAVAAYEKWAKAHPPQPPPAEPAGPEPARPEPPRPGQPRPEQPGQPRPEQPGATATGAAGATATGAAGTRRAIADHPRACCPAVQVDDRLPDSRARGAGRATATARGHTQTAFRRGAKLVAWRQSALVLAEDKQGAVDRASALARPYDAYAEIWLGVFTRTRSLPYFRNEAILIDSTGKVVWTLRRLIPSWGELWSRSRVRAWFPWPTLRMGASARSSATTWATLAYFARLHTRFRFLLLHS